MPISCGRCSLLNPPGSKNGEYDHLVIVHHGQTGRSCLVCGESCVKAFHYYYIQWWSPGLGRGFHLMSQEDRGNIDYVQYGFLFTVLMKHYIICNLKLLLLDFRLSYLVRLIGDLWFKTCLKKISSIVLKLWAFQFGNTEHALTH